MLSKIKSIERKYDDIGEQLTSPDIMKDMQNYTRLSREYKDLSKIVEQGKIYQNIYSNIENNKNLLSAEKDSEMRQMIKDDLDELVPKLAEMEDKLQLMLVPKDPNDAKNVILEIRSGVGGDEAALFAGSLYRMYQRFSEIMGWKFELIDCTEGPAGGFKEIICNVHGENVFGILKYESGVHRVQRVPTTETQGRVHTSAASVVVLPEAEEFDIKLDMNDIRKDLFCSSGPGGQSVNTTYSAVRLTHVPTGTIAQCQDEKSQHRNYEKALNVLRSRLYEVELEKINADVGAQRKSMVGRGDRSDKIRTYNFPQSRVTDHRIGLTLYNLAAILDGAIEEIIEQLRLADNMEKMKVGEG